MNKVFKIIKNLSLNLSSKMIKALLSKPLLLLPTVWSTIESILFSELNFQEAHGGRGVANAFRHAAWNLLIAKNCAHFTSKEKAIEWAKFITDLHEECFPNDLLDQEMDLHNNQIGRTAIQDLWVQNIYSKNQMIQYLVEKCKTAIPCSIEFESIPTEIKNFNELVFIS